MKQTQLIEQRCSVRFPLHLKVAVRTDSHEHKAETQNISSGGVLMNLETELKPDTPIEFTILMPAEVLGSPSDVEVNCVGRVVRSAENEGQHTVAAVIDEYQFKRP
jgi:c-di-GMP-binding flagellar brake protein YcgR